MATSNVQTLSGNRIVVTFDGVAVGLVQNVRLNDSYGLEAASGVGDIHVVEHVPSRAIHSVSVSSMILYKNKLSDAGAAIPENGDAALKGLVFDIVSFSRDSGKVVRKVRGCSFDSGDIDISAHRITSRSAQCQLQFHHSRQSIRDFEERLLPAAPRLPEHYAAVIGREHPVNAVLRSVGDNGRHLQIVLVV